MLWVAIGLILYLVAGFFFNTSGFSGYKRVLLHIFWLPAVLLIYMVLKTGK